MAISKTQAKRFFKLSIKDKVWVFLYYIIIGELIFRFQKWYNFSGRYKFINRSNKKEKLLVVVAFYKEYFWDIFFERVARFADPDMDVCICVPKKDIEKIREIAKKYGWSYLTTKDNKLSLAQNLAIRLHPAAKYVYKLDEDILIGKNYFKNIFETYKKIKKEGLYKPGLIVPVLNINGCTHIHFLRFVSAENEYREKFGEFHSSTAMDTKCHSSAEAAIFLWSKSFPFDKLAEDFEEKNAGKYELIPHKYSIGAIFCEVEFWKKTGYFKVAPEYFMGVEESHLAQFSFENSYPIILASNTFAGHLAYGPQNPGMKEYFEKNKEKFSL